MKKVLALLALGFESSSIKTPEFKAFAKVFKNELKKELESIGASKIEFSIGHFYISGFFTTSRDNIYYFSISDVRGSDFILESGREIELMYRTTDSYKDYTGGCNQFIAIGEGMVDKMNIY